MNKKAEMNKEEYEERYQRFVSMWEQDWKVDTIARHLGIKKYTITGDRYYGRYIKEHGKTKKSLIDREKMMTLIHTLEQKYHIGDYIDGREIKFGDGVIPENDPQLIELRKVVNGK